MLKVKIYSLGKIRQKFILDGEAEYLKRLQSSLKIEIIELQTKKSSSQSTELIRKNDTKYFLKQLPAAEYLIALDESAKLLDTHEFTVLFERASVSSGSKLSFAIGGAYGWSEEIKTRVSVMLSLSPLTFSYSLARLVLVEQIYRAHSIIHGLPYSK